MGSKKKANVKKKSRAQGGRAVRQKGHSFERECALALRKVYPDAKRHLEVQKCEALGYDLDNTGPFKFQCKRNVKYAPLNKIEEVQAASGDIPALITKGDHKKAIVALYLDDFIKILNDIGEAFVGVPDEITVDDF